MTAGVDSIVAATSNGSAATLIRLFLIALVIIAPYGLWQWRAARARRAGAAGAAPAVDVPSGSSSGASGGEALGDGVAAAARRAADDHDLARVIERIAEFGTHPDATTTEPFDVVIDDRSHVDGQRLGIDVMEALLVDCARRAGVRIASDGPTQGAIRRWRVG